MTRETKIGLLVGLAFIIVIGILLSDHLTSQNEPVPAPLELARRSLTLSTQTPGGGQIPANPPAAPGLVAPAAPVPTAIETTPRPVPPPVERIAIGGPPRREFNHRHRFRKHRSHDSRGANRPGPDRPGAPCRPTGGPNSHGSVAHDHS